MPSWSFFFLFPFIEPPVLAVAKGVLDDSPERLAAAQAFLVDPANAPVTAALQPMPAIQQARLTMGGKVQAGGREYAPFPCAARGTLPPPRQRGRGCARPRRHARQLGGHGRRRGRRDALGDAGRLGGGARGVGRRRRPALPLSGRLPLPRRCATTWAPLRSPSSSSGCSASPRPSHCPCGACSRPRV